MSVDRGLLVILEAQPGKEDELAAFLTQAQPLAAAEPGTDTDRLKLRPGVAVPLVKHIRPVRVIVGRLGGNDDTGGAVLAR